MQDKKLGEGCWVGLIAKNQSTLDSCWKLHASAHLRDTY